MKLRVIRIKMRLRKEDSRETFAPVCSDCADRIIEETPVSEKFSISKEYDSSLEGDRCQICNKTFGPLKMTR